MPILNNTPEVSGEDELSTLHLLGLLSAQLTHSLSNQLSIITGNICAAGALRDDPEKASAALQAAITGANGTGVLLGRFADLRRSIRSERPFTSTKRLCDAIRRWAEHSGWKLDSDDGRIPHLFRGAKISCAELNFVLSSVQAKSNSEPGSISFHGAAEIQHDSRTAGDRAPTAVLPIKLQASAPLDLDWPAARTSLDNFQFAAASEILSLSGATPRTVRSGHLLKTEIDLPLFEF
jgi:hypothetical protein